MKSLNQLVVLLWLLPIGTFMWDLIDGWFFQNRLKFRSVQEWAQIIGPHTPTSIRKVLGNFLSSELITSIMAQYASLVLIVFPVTMYIIYRIALAIKNKTSVRR